MGSTLRSMARVRRRQPCPIPPGMRVTTRLFGRGYGDLLLWKSRAEMSVPTLQSAIAAAVSTNGGVLAGDVGSQSGGVEHETAFHDQTLPRGRDNRKYGITIVPVCDGGPGGFSAGPPTAEMALRPLLLSRDSFAQYT